MQLNLVISLKPMLTFAFTTIPINAQNEIIVILDLNEDLVLNV